MLILNKLDHFCGTRKLFTLTKRISLQQTQPSLLCKLDHFWETSLHRQKYWAYWNILHSSHLNFGDYWPYLPHVFSLKNTLWTTHIGLNVMQKVDHLFWIVTLQLLNQKQAGRLSILSCLWSMATELWRPSLWKKCISNKCRWNKSCRAVDNVQNPTVKF